MSSFSLLLVDIFFVHWVNIIFNPEFAGYSFLSTIACERVNFKTGNFLKTMIRRNCKRVNNMPIFSNHLTYFYRIPLFGFVETIKYNWTLRETKFSLSRGWMSMDTWRSNQKMAAKPSVCNRTETVTIWWGTWFTWRHTEGPLQSEIYLDTCTANPALDIPVYQCIEQAS